MLRNTNLTKINIKNGLAKTFEGAVRPVIRRKWMPEEMLGKHIKVQCVLSFYPLEEEGPPFFDFFRKAIVDAQVEVEVPLEARIELEGEI